MSWCSLEWMVKPHWEQEMSMEEEDSSETINKERSVRNMQEYTMEVNSLQGTTHIHTQEQFSVHGFRKQRAVENRHSSTDSNPEALRCQ